MPLIALSGSDILAAMLSGRYWAGGADLVLTYSTPSVGSVWPGYPNAALGGEPFLEGYSVFTSGQAQTFAVVVELMDSFVGASFTLVDDQVDLGAIRIAFTSVDPDVWGYAYYPDVNGNPNLDDEPGDIWISSNVAGSAFTSGGFDFLGLMHEIGHALGLQHSFEGDHPLPEQFDNYRYTIMSYSSQTDHFVARYALMPFGMSISYNPVYPITPMLADIYALQNLFGADPATRAGDTSYTFDPNLGVIQTIYDAGGIDTWSLIGHLRPSFVDLRPGAFSSVDCFSREAQIEANVAAVGEVHRSDITQTFNGASIFTWTDNVAIAFGTIIENVDLGDADDSAIGNDAANIIRGFAGSDLLDGGGGDDTLDGGIGDDTLNGGTNADNMQGGDGNDMYVVDDALDVTTESAGQGMDTVQSSVTRTLGANFENLTLTGSANLDGTGNTEINVINGNTGNNTLSGLDGNDTINGGDGDDIIIGGWGIDSLNGGEGNDGFAYTIGDGNGSVNGGNGSDSFVITDVAGLGSILNANLTGSVLTAVAGNGLTSIESVFANMGDGVDWLIYNTSSDVAVNFTTTAATGFAGVSNVERVVGGSGNDMLTGDNLDNRLDGSTGSDTLAGLGGIDTLIGGDGDDWITGGLANDSIQGGNGNDNIGWVVGDGRDTIDGGADFDTFSVVGSASAELGNATWNGLSVTALIDNGLSNLEAINLDLGGGVDWLIYNASAAAVVNLQLGTASGFASVSNIEKVIGGSGNDTLTGDTLDNRLDGLAGADTLDGGAGSDAVLGGDGNDTIYASAGNDSLQGQNGNDTFIWTSTDGRDTFNGGADTDTVNFTGSAVADVADANWNGTEITGLLNNALVSIETINLELGAGGAGGDWLRYNSTVGVTVNLLAGTGSGFASITGVENLIGGTGADTLTGDGGANKISGNNGDDIITGGGGNDNLTGGVGNDTFVYAAGSGNDTIVDFDAWAVGGQDFLDVSAFGINAGNFAARVAIIDTGADTVIRIDDTYFITLKNVSGDGDNVITQADFIFGP
ncbi:reprolysin-like metallopeptidase [Candidatus Viadribacter manganicus]|uniref:Peptidase metallopeptidase domain-containing protein n=1 Tax=Candidatus Viadribacter manganicus TaxID=1759059 RepID=A0A1B1ALV2_9PROT|nr:hypothetical protein [Candidatus Viadribacter manganicus]ANP47552.1 hypothetical protein ATE48_17400 [Candidatus Viadribacter manganicus]